MFQLTGYFTRFGSKSDGSASLSFNTQELNGEDFATLKQHQNLFGYIMFSENKFTDSDLPKEQAEDKNKTPSKRLRSVLFILWQQEGSEGDFEVWYRDRMEKLIDKIKAKLD